MSLRMKPPELELQTAEFLRAWHKAASNAYEERFFGMMDPKATFVGTDDREIWTLKELRAASKKFTGLPAWPMQQRMLKLTMIHYSSIGIKVSFIELLQSDRLGPCRGAGVLLATKREWQIELYVLSLSVPNIAVEEVKAVVARHSS